MKDGVFIYVPRFLITPWFLAYLHQGEIIQKIISDKNFYFEYFLQGAVRPSL